MNLLIFLQASVADTAAADMAGEIRMSYWELAMKGGWVMVPIILLSSDRSLYFLRTFFCH